MAIRAAWQKAPSGSREGKLGRLVRSAVAPADELSDATGSPPVDGHVNPQEFGEVHR